MQTEPGKTQRNKIYHMETNAMFISTKRFSANEDLLPLERYEVL